MNNGRGEVLDLSSTAPNHVAIINISNENVDGEIVLNDQHLLNLIQRFPFLYNPLSQAFGDADYAEWAWQLIFEAFNESYLNTQSRCCFSIVDLRQRWHELQPFIVGLGKLDNLDIIPEPLRQLVVTISAVLDSQAHIQPKHATSVAQSTVLENIPWVEHLPLGERKQLEAEMMELILTTELASKGSVRLCPAIERSVEQEYEGFLKAIRLKELFVLNIAEKQKLPEPIVLPLSVFDATDTNSFSTIPAAAEEGKSLQDPLQYRKKLRPCMVRIKRLNLDEVPLARLRTRFHYKKN